MFWGTSHTSMCLGLVSQGSLKHFGQVTALPRLGLVLSFSSSFPYDAATGAEQFPLREVQTPRGCTPYTLCDACQSSLSHVVTPDKALKSEGCSRLPV